MVRKILPYTLNTLLLFYSEWYDDKLSIQQRSIFLLWRHGTKTQKSKKKTQGNRSDHRNRIFSPFNYVNIEIKWNVIINILFGNALFTFVSDNEMSEYVYCKYSASLFFLLQLFERQRTTQSRSWHWCTENGKDFFFIFAYIFFKSVQRIRKSS